MRDIRAGRKASMVEGKSDNADRYAAGSGGTESDAKAAEKDGMRPGITGGGTNYLPETGRASTEGSGAEQAAGTVGAVGEMDITGAPAGPAGGSGISGGSGAGETQGGGPGGGGAASGGGTGPSAADAGPQSLASTVAVLGDRELSTGQEGMGGAGGTGGAGGSDVAGDDARTSTSGTGDN